MKAYRESKVWLHSFLTLVLYGSEPTGIPPQKNSFILFHKEGKVILHKHLKSWFVGIECYATGVSDVCVFSLQVNAICTDLVFTYFICPAIVNPEPYGITDAPISYVSRFNLIQVAKILQMLAMTKYEDVDNKVSDLYNLFEKVNT